VAGSPPARDVQYLLEHAPALRDQPWVRYHVKDGEKGPIVWEAKHTRVTVKDEHGLPGMGLHLVMARNVLDAEEVKFFVSNASPETPVDVLLLVGFSRWQVERCFEDQKQEVGLDQWEGRTWRSLKRHLILSAISYLFLARVRQGLRGKNPELTICQVHLAVSALIRSWSLSRRASRRLIEKTARRIRYSQQRKAAARKSHYRRTLRKLREIGINIKNLIRCKWP